MKELSAEPRQKMLLGGLLSREGRRDNDADTFMVGNVPGRYVVPAHRMVRTRAAGGAGKRLENTPLRALSTRMREKFDAR
jgi:hypothetical protein